MVVYIRPFELQIELIRSTGIDFCVAALKAQFMCVWPVEIACAWKHTLRNLIDRPSDRSSRDRPHIRVISSSMAINLIEHRGIRCSRSVRIQCESATVELHSIHLSRLGLDGIYLTTVGRRKGRFENSVECVSTSQEMFDQVQLERKSQVASPAALPKD